MTPDALGGDITNPQSLNRYAYVLNNPTTLTDPSGLDPCNLSNGSYEGSGSPFPCGAASDYSPSGVSYTLDGVDVPASIAIGALEGGFACLGSCSTAVVASNGVTYQAVQTAGPTVYVGLNGEELSDSSVAELGLPPLSQLGGLGMGLGPSALGVGGGSGAGGTVSAAGCPAKILGSFNGQFGTNAPISAVQNLGPRGLGNVTINVNIFFPLGTLAPGVVVPGRFGGGQFGMNSSLHVKGFSVGPRAGYPGLFDIALTHLDEGNAYKFPLGTLSHLNYVLTHSAGPCP